MKKSVIIPSILFVSVGFLLSSQSAFATTYPQLVSVASDGTQQNADIFDAWQSISANGRYITFITESHTLVPNDTNGISDVFVHDNQTGITQRVSVAADGTQANDESFDASISPDGRYVAFRSSATNLVPGVTDNNYPLYIRDLQNGTIEHIDGAGYGGGLGYNSISADNRYIVYDVSTSNNTIDIFVRDLQTGTTEQVSAASDGTAGNSYSYSPSISANGRYVIFGSAASNLVPGDTNNTDDAFVHDRQTGTTERISIASDGTQANDSSGPQSISSDGRYIAFTSRASNLVAGDTNDVQDAFVRDRQAGTTERVSVASDGSEGNSSSGQPFISGDGRYVVFVSSASNLVPGDTNNTDDAFVHDRQTGITKRVTVATDGTEANSSTKEVFISSDGHYITFNTRASNLGPTDTNLKYDVYVTINPFSPPVTNHTPAVGTVSVTPSSANVNTSVSVSASFTDADTANTHTATINWGDGTATQSGTVSESNGSGTVTGSHTYTATGSHTVTVKVTDNAGASATGTATATVIPATGLTLGNIQGADYSGANLSGQNMFGTNARGTNFTGANLSGANMTFSNDSGANFTNANLTNVNFAFANVRNANMTGANLTGANFAGAQTAGIIWSNTTCPNGQNSSAHNNSCAGQGGGL